MLRGELFVGHRGAAGEIDFALVIRSQEHDDPCAAALSAFAAQTCAAVGRRRRLRVDARASVLGPVDLRGSAAGDPLAAVVVDEAARRIAVHVLPIAAVVDVELVVLGGGIGANGDLLLAPDRAPGSPSSLPFAPSVEVSTLGDAAVLTGALAIGLDVALESAFAGRAESVT